MNLAIFDDRYVRIRDNSGTVFEGQCTVQPSGYCLHVFDREEEALEIDHWMFFPSDTESIEIIGPEDVHVWMDRPLHQMHLDPGPYSLIEKRKKTIELRLYDEKRRRMRIGDVIRFESTQDETDVLYAEITDLYVFPSFAELYRNLPLRACGYTEENIASASPDDMERYWPKQLQEHYGVLGIRIAVLP